MKTNEAKRRDLVPCYPLSAVLTPEQMDAVRPWLRGTFTETWEALRTPWTNGGHGARYALMVAAGVSGSLWRSYEETGRRIEAALYHHAGRRGATPVMAKGRGR